MRKMKAKRNIWFAFIIVVIIVIGYCFKIVMNVYVATEEAHVEINREGNQSELRTEEITVGNDPISILLMGIEDYETNGQNGRADTQIVVTLNPHTKQMTMTTIPRDTRTKFTVEEAGQYAGFHKLNAAYTYGSITGYGEVELQIEKVEELLGIPIDEYIAVNFDGFRDIIDILGGVIVDIKEPFWEKNFYVDGQKIYFEKGESKLNGEEALAFVRMRKREVNNNYSREERQRQFIQATVDQVISTGTLFKLGEITNILGQNVTTSLSPKEIIHLQKVYSLVNTEIKTYEIEGQDQIMDGIYYFIPNQESINELAGQLKLELELTAVNPTED